VRRETGKEQMVQFHQDKGVASRIDPESCAAAREGISEALPVSSSKVVSKVANRATKTTSPASRTRSNSPTF
jgi:hypothetical protein